MSDIAIAHKDYAVAGGGEILAERLGLCFDAPVYTGYVKDRNRADLRADVRGLWNDGVINKLLRHGGVARSILYQHLWENVEELHQYDTIIQSGNEPLWYIPREQQTTIAYTHSTPRLMYDLHTRQANHDGYTGFVGDFITGWLRKKQRERYYHVTRYPDLFVANSELVAQRIQKYWGIRDDRIRTVHPPVAVEEYGPEYARNQYDDYYLSINRLSTWKRIDEIVDAFKDRDETLLIAGKGSEKEKLEQRASDADNIKFLGFVSDDEKKALLAGAKATVYNPLNEDFGIVPIESLASGTPLVSVDDGFQQFQLDDGKTAVKYQRHDTNRDVTVRNLDSAISRFEAEGVAFDTGELQEAVEHYRISRFNREMREAVEYARARSEVEVSAPEPDGLQITDPPAIETDGGTNE